MPTTRADEPASTAPAAPGNAQDSGSMTRRQIVQALVGMLLGLFTAFLSSTIVSNALPTIITDLHGSQSQYTWVVTATLLSSTASTPIWGKLSDLFSKKLMVQIAIAIYIGGSVAAGFSHSVDILIVWRAVQGLGLGALQSLVVIVIAAMISPRDRGRYTGPIAGVMSVATVAGPLIGGLIVDSSLGWRWCFWVGAPLAIVAMIVVQRTLNLPVIKRQVKVDYLGAALIAAGVCDLLIWVTLAGTDFAWNSGTSFALVGIGVVLLGLALLVESRAAEPIVPLYLFKERTTSLATIASVAVGVAMFGSAVFLGQYFQIARSYSPTASGLLTLPMIVGSTLSATLSGQLISRLGRWKGFLVAGAVLMVAGFGLLATTDHATDMVLIGTYLGVLGLGMGMVMQNLVLAVQNTVKASDLGAASSTVTFFRSLGGTIGVSVLGAILASQVAGLTTEGLVRAGVPTSGAGSGEVGIGSLNELPPFVADIVRAAYGDGTARIFLVAAALAVVSLLAILFIKEVPLRTLSGIEQQKRDAEVAAPAVAVAEPATPAHGADPVGAGPGVHGVVSAAGGVGLHNAVVTLTGARGEQVGRTTTDAAGRYEFHLPGGGTYLLVVSSGTLRPSASMVVVVDGSARHDVTLQGGSEVIGTIRRGEAAAPAAGITVMLIDEFGDVAATTRTDEAGRYRIAGISAGTFTLTASGAGHQPVAATITLVEGTPAIQDLQLPSRADLHGTVIAAGNGRGVPDAIAMLVAADGQVVGTAITGDDGGFTFNDLADGTYILAAAGYAPDVQSVRVDAGRTTTVQVVLDRPAAEGISPRARTNGRTP